MRASSASPRHGDLQVKAASPTRPDLQSFPLGRTSFGSASMYSADSRGPLHTASSRSNSAEASLHSLISSSQHSGGHIGAQSPSPGHSRSEQLTQPLLRSSSDLEANLPSHRSSNHPPDSPSHLAANSRTRPRRRNSISDAFRRCRCSPDSREVAGQLERCWDTPAAKWVTGTIGVCGFVFAVTFSTITYSIGLYQGQCVCPPVAPAPGVSPPFGSPF